MGANFGVAGNSDAYALLFKNNLNAPVYVKNFGLDAYEYQCGHGVRINPNTAAQFCENAKMAGVSISLHSPYYISISSAVEETRLKSIDYILESARAVKMLGGRRIVVHSGSVGKLSRVLALELAKDTIKRAIAALDNEGLGDVVICPETMGKIGQLGTLDEVMQLCKLDERLIPCIDFGHLNARTQGSIKGKADFLNILKEIENELGFSRLKSFHSHFSKIEYTQMGEKRHLTFDDEMYGPDFVPLAEILAEKDLSPTLICESRGTQDRDALFVKNAYLGALTDNNNLKDTLENENFSD